MATIQTYRYSYNDQKHIFPKTSPHSGWQLTLIEFIFDTAMARRGKAQPERYPLRFLGRKLEELTAKKRQQENNWGQGDVARWLGVSENQLSRWINGHAHPSEEDWPKLAAFGVLIDELEELEEIDKLDAWRRPLLPIEALERWVKLIRQAVQENETAKAQSWNSTESGTHPRS